MALHCGDCLEIMGDMPSDSIDLIATDPPFNTGKDWGQFNDKWDGGLDGYLDFMKPRLQEMHRLLKDTGSLYLHCDTNASHYLKVMLDGIFGMDNFRNEIVWKSATGAKNNVKHRFGRGHDSILFYAMPKSQFNIQYIPIDEDYLKRYYNYRDQEGRRFQPSNLNSQGNKGYRYTFLGVTKNWRMTEKQAHQWLSEGRIVHESITPESNVKIPRYKLYADESKGIPILDNWTDIEAVNSQSKKNTGYPTQKPLALLERIIKASSNECDVVLDPFCGSGTTLEAAKLLGRKWIGIDMNPEAIEITSKRLNPEQMDLF